MWISLAQLGVVHNGTEAALEAFAKRQMSVQTLAWADAGIMFKLIEALKAMAQRSGWDQSLDGVPPSQTLHVLKLRLCEALLLKLKEAGTVPGEMRLKQAAWSLLGLEDEHGVGPMLWSVEHLDILAKGLAGKIREVMRPVSVMEIAR